MLSKKLFVFSYSKYMANFETFRLDNFIKHKPHYHFCFAYFLLHFFNLNLYNNFKFFFIYFPEYLKKKKTLWAVTFLKLNKILRFLREKSYYEPSGYYSDDQNQPNQF